MKKTAKLLFLVITLTFCLGKGYELTKSPHFRKPASFSEGECREGLERLLLGGRQSQSLAQSLKSMSIDMGTIDPYKALNLLSKKNITRYLLPAKKVSVEVSEIIESLEMVFVHNRSPRAGQISIEGDALLSARKLGRGAQNTYNYNREFLKSDDNVFFFIKFIAKDFPRENVGGFGISYGQVSYHLDKNYAAKYGWISPFNMYPRELANFLRIRDKYPEAQELLKGLRNSGIAATEEELASIPREVLNELSVATFNPTDFEKLVKTNLMAKLESLKQSNYKEFLRISDILQKGEPNEIDAILREYIFVPLGIASTKKRYEMFEFKTPSHIPKENITIYGPDSNL